MEETAKYMAKQGSRWACLWHYARMVSMLELITVLVMPGRRILKQRPDALDGYDMVETIAMNMILSKSKLDAV